jgi:hypothetical protein
MKSCVCTCAYPAAGSLLDWPRATGSEEGHERAIGRQYSPVQRKWQLTGGSGFRATRTVGTSPRHRLSRWEARDHRGHLTRGHPSAISTTGQLARGQPNAIKNHWATCQGQPNAIKTIGQLARGHPSAIKTIGQLTRGCLR